MTALLLTFAVRRLFDCFLFSFYFSLLCEMTPASCFWIFHPLPILCLLGTVCTKCYIILNFFFFIPFLFLFLGWCLLEVVRVMLLIIMVTVDFVCSRFSFLPRNGAKRTSGSLSLPSLSLFLCPYFFVFWLLRCVEDGRVGGQLIKALVRQVCRVSNNRCG